MVIPFTVLTLKPGEFPLLTCLCLSLIHLSTGPQVGGLWARGVVQSVRPQRACRAQDLEAVRKLLQVLLY